MIDTILNWMSAFSFTSWVGFGLYWVPLSICAYGYTVRTWLNYQKDVAARDEAKDGHYSPTDTIGTLIGRGIVTVTPVANLWVAAFDVAPKMFASFFHFVGKLFDQPLVPKRKAKS